LAPKKRAERGYLPVSPPPRGREFDIAIAACAILHSATVRTLNPSDYSDIPGIFQFQA
jgi:predicted nucleic acid-binding protein